MKVTTENLQFTLAIGLVQLNFSAIYANSGAWIYFLGTFADKIFKKLTAIFRVTVLQAI